MPLYRTADVGLAGRKIVQIVRCGAICDGTQVHTAMSIPNDLDQSDLVVSAGEVLDGAALNLEDRPIDGHGGPSRAILTKMRDDPLPILSYRGDGSHDRRGL